MVQPYYDHAGITIYHADCRDVLPGIIADVLITDPPYGINFAEYASHDDDAAGYREFIWPIIETAEKCLAQGSICAVFQSETKVKDWPILVPRDFRLIAACKKFGQMGRELLARQVDYILYWSIGGWRWTRAAGESARQWQPQGARNWFVSDDCCRTGPGQRPDHPCPRPLDTMRYLVARLAPPSSIVLDPFAGSGTTLRAAKDLGRKAIGIEIEERYCEIAARRMAQEVLFKAG